MLRNPIAFPHLPNEFYLLIIHTSFPLKVPIPSLTFPHPQLMAPLQIAVVRQETPLPPNLQTYLCMYPCFLASFSSEWK